MKKDFNSIKNEIGHKVLKDNPLTVLERLGRLSEKRFSDVISKDEEGRMLQWINFVQEGGGTLGISLVGYTFVLEYAGIRFLRIAGTSAGAINTLFLAAMGDKDEPKSAELYDMMMDDKRFALSSFVDAKSRLVRALIFSFSSGSGLVSNLRNFYLIVSLLTLLVIPILMFFGVMANLAYAICFTLFAAITLTMVVLLYRFRKFRYGINPGKRFEEFLAEELKKFKVGNLEDLKDKAEGYFDLNTKISSSAPIVKGEKWYAGIYSQILGMKPSQKNSGNPAQLYLIRDNKSLEKEPLQREQSDQKSIDKIRFDYSFVTTDIANQCKIVLPQDQGLYEFKPAEDNPAAFVRCSMAIPLFFEPKIIRVNKNGGWEKSKGFNNLCANSIFIDGGSLSNFPINLFHNSHIAEARVPIFGARIKDRRPVENEKPELTFKKYIGSIISTFRNNEDSSFLAINPFYKKYSIAEIKTYNTKINWLNFKLSKDEKITLLMAGVEAALLFLEQFDWDVYKDERKKTL